MMHERRSVLIIQGHPDSSEDPLSRSRKALRRRRPRRERTDPQEI